MVRRLRGGLAELFNRNLGRRDVGVAEAEVDDVDPVARRIDLELVDQLEDVRRQIRDAAELHGLDGSYDRLEVTP